MSTLRLVRSCVGEDCQWTALKGGSEFLGPEETRKEVARLFKAAGGEGEAMDEGEEEEEDAAVPQSIRSMYDKPIAMSALGGMIWCVVGLVSALTVGTTLTMPSPSSSTGICVS